MLWSDHLLTTKDIVVKCVCENRVLFYISPCHHILTPQSSHLPHSCNMSFQYKPVLILFLYPQWTRVTALSLFINLHNYSPGAAIHYILFWRLIKRIFWQSAKNCLSPWFYRQKAVQYYWFLLIFLEEVFVNSVSRTLKLRIFL